MTGIEIETNRDFLYSALSVLSTPLLLYTVFDFNWFQNVVSDNDDLIAPNPKTSLYIWLFEFIKILIVTWCWPTDYILDSKLDNDGKKYRLPFSKNQKDFKDVDKVVGSSGGSKFYAVVNKVIHIFNGLVNFLAGIALCHLMLVFFGAPVINKWKLTLEFSCLLVSWLYFPLTFVIRPSSIVQELVYISSWKHKNSSLCRAKWRFLLTLFGAWIGAVVMPLDWDRPWQKWPIPCIFSSFATYSLINFAYCLYIIYRKIIQKRRRYDSSSSSVTQKSSKSPMKSKSKYF